MADSPTRGLAQDDVDAFWRDGYLCVANAVSSEQLAALRAQLDAWVEESRAHAGPYGETFDGRPRFDVAPSHCAQAPALRRVDNPQCVAEVYARVAFDSRLTDMVADLIGPNVKFHHAKINAKLPGNETRVEYHQDFAYTPHTNDDLITALLLLDDMDSSNGPLRVVSGSHVEGVKSLWDGDTFTGKVDGATAAECEARAATLTGAAGSVCLMHTNLLHGSAENFGEVVLGQAPEMVTVPDGDGMTDRTIDGRLGRRPLVRLRFVIGGGGFRLEMGYPVAKSNAPTGFPTIPSSTTGFRRKTASPGKWKWRRPA